MTQLNVVILGAWHVHARDYAKDTLEHPDTNLVGVWDENEQLGQELADELGVAYYANLDEALALEGLDAVVITTATVEHVRVIPAAAAAGKHIFTEKVIAATPAEVATIEAAVAEAGVILHTSLPRMTHGYTHTIDEILDSGELGPVRYVRVRLAHNGGPAGWLPARFFNAHEAQGGALTDLGCHPVYLTRHFLRHDEPATVRATYGETSGQGVDDHAVVTFAHSDGAIGVAEASFVTGASDFSIEIHGELGSVLYGFGDERLRVGIGSEWSVRECAPNSADQFARFVTSVHTNTQDVANLATARSLTQLVDAANRSAATGQPVPCCD